MPQLYIKNQKNNEMMFSLAWNMFTDNQKVLVLNFLEGKNVAFFSQIVDGNVIFTEYGKVLVLIFLGMGNTAFFEPKSWWKHVIYGLLKSSYFELFGDRKYGLFLSQEVDGKVMANTGLSSAKKLMKTWYILGLFEVSMIFRDLRNMLFPAVYVTKWKEKKCVFLLSDSSIKLQKFKMIINHLKIFHVIIEKLFNVNSCFYLFLLLYFS